MNERYRNNRLTIQQKGDFRLKGIIHIHVEPPD